MLRRTLVTLALSALALAGCGKKGPDPAVVQANGAEAAAFMTRTAKEPGVKALPGGVLYKVLVSGPTDGVSPRPGDEIKVHYEGKLPGGDVFDSSFERGQPAVMQLIEATPSRNGLIGGWVDGMTKMKPGDVWVLYIPPARGYGEDGGGPIPPNAALEFKIQLIAVLPAAGGSGFGR